MLCEKCSCVREHQTSLNYVCSGAATWTNSATVNQLVYHSGCNTRLHTLSLTLFDYSVFWLFFARSFFRFRSYFAKKRTHETFHCYHHIVLLLFGWHISESFPLYNHKNIYLCRGMSKRGFEKSAHTHTSERAGAHTYTKDESKANVYK